MVGLLVFLIVFCILIMVSGVWVSVEPRRSLGIRILALAGSGAAGIAGVRIAMSLLEVL